ncbi:hypothetical protein DV515_00018170, partial [Chloebia gouldiae]
NTEQVLRSGPALSAASARLQPGTPIRLLLLAEESREPSPSPCAGSESGLCSCSAPGARRLLPSPDRRGSRSRQGTRCARERRGGRRGTGALILGSCSSPAAAAGSSLAPSSGPGQERPDRHRLLPLRPGPGQRFSPAGPSGSVGAPAPRERREPRAAPLSEREAAQQTRPGDNREPHCWDSKSEAVLRTEGNV